MATVTIAGATGTAQIEVAEGATVVDVLLEAADVLGLTSLVIEVLAPIVNGEDAELDTPVAADDTVSAAPQVANG